MVHHKHKPRTYKIIISCVRTEKNSAIQLSRFHGFRFARWAGSLACRGELVCLLLVLCERCCTAQCSPGNRVFSLGWEGSLVLSSVPKDAIHHELTYLCAKRSNSDPVCIQITELSTLSITFTASIMNLLCSNDTWTWWNCLRGDLRLRADCLFVYSYQRPMWSFVLQSIVYFQVLSR